MPKVEFAMLLWHHLDYNKSVTTFDGFEISYYGDNNPTEKDFKPAK